MLQHENPLAQASAGIWTADQTFNDNIKLLFGALGADGELYSDGTDMFFNQLSGGGIMIGLAASPPSPDGVSVHIWRGTAGSVPAPTGSLLVLEDDALLGISLLAPATNSKFISFGSPDSSTDARILYDEASARFDIRVGNSERLQYSAGAFAFQEATTISTTSGDLTLNPAGGDVKLDDNVRLGFGGAPDVGLQFSTADVDNHTFVLSLANGNQGFHITDQEARATDWAIAATTHPNVYIHSNTTPATDYLRIGNHDGITAEIDVLGGGLDIQVAGTTRVGMDGTGLGFFATTPAAQPTGVAVTAAGIHAALVTLGLITS